MALELTQSWAQAAGRMTAPNTILPLQEGPSRERPCKEGQSLPAATICHVYRLQGTHRLESSSSSRSCKVQLRAGAQRWLGRQKTALRANPSLEMDTRYTRPGPAPKGCWPRARVQDKALCRCHQKKGGFPEWHQPWMEAPTLPDLEPWALPSPAPHGHVLWGQEPL